MAESDPIPAVGVFGEELASAESLAESTTTSLSFVQKLNLLTPVIPAGDYYIEWSLAIGSLSSDSDAEFQVQVDNVTTLSDQFNSTNFKAGEIRNYSGFARLTLTNAAHNIDVDFQSSGDFLLAHIFNARLILWRLT